ncbi:DUF2946 domain-containing protein [Pseudomonas sp. MAFF 302030]|uniref:DUF2946 domain-containing protein n=1 Tax=Pseudomonas morbosilactucae TaxID=2938197 RepID=A0A9X1YTT7_9PSED|nr:DUF2946 domain-containing protein [Pseudomonas morbosilactucae]MCK9798073.1 DUF2946 domain-containing protein [Pseudomonas morbosilactucae]
MKIARNERSLVAWILYGCILFSACTCAISHGQMAGLQLAGLEGQPCSIGGNFDAGAQFDDSGLVTPITATDSTCVLVSLFSAIILAAFFCLWGLLAAAQTRPLCNLQFPRLTQHRWPTANPRASPFGLPVL